MAQLARGGHEYSNMVTYTFRPEKGQISWVKWGCSIPQEPEFKIQGFICHIQKHLFLSLFQHSWLNITSSLSWCRTRSCELMHVVFIQVSWHDQKTKVEVGSKYETWSQLYFFLLETKYQLIVSCLCVGDVRNQRGVDTDEKKGKWWIYILYHIVTLWK